MAANNYRVNCLGLTGLAGAGKDTIGRLLEPYGFVPMGFADALRSDLYTLNPMVSADTTLRQLVDALGWNEAKRQYPEVRRLMQVYGTDVVRNAFGSKVWIDRAEPAMAQIYAAGKRPVFTDLRFANEAIAIGSRWFGLVVEVRRPGAGLSGAEAAHVSESGIPDEWIDGVFENDCPLDELPGRVDGLVHDLQLVDIY